MDKAKNINGISSPEFESCETKSTSGQSFNIIQSGGAILDVYDIFCDNPAFDTLGRVHYKAKVSLTNPPSSGGNWVVNSLTINPGGQTIPTTSFRNCFNPLLSPIGNVTIAPGTTSTWCFDFHVPFGSTLLTSSANGTMFGAPSIVSDQDSLPSCVCTICDDWQFNTSNKAFNWIGEHPTFKHNAQLFETIQLIGADPIMEMNAEVVSIEHHVSDPQCYTCTKDDDYMGLFAFDQVGNRQLNATAPWQNAGFGQPGYDENVDGYANQVKWLCDDPYVGVDFSIPRSIRLTINLPKRSTLDCCQDAYEVCVRYTFTDINCNTCSYQVCYDYDSSASTGGSGSGTGTGSGGVGLGNQSPSSLPRVSSVSKTIKKVGQEPLKDTSREARDAPIWNTTMEKERSDKVNGSNNENLGKKSNDIELSNDINEAASSSPYDACDCYIEVQGANVIGKVEPCPLNTPSKTKIIITQDNTTLSWGDQRDYPQHPRVNNLPKGKSYHASVKSKFGAFWYSECGTDFTVDYDVTGTISFTENLSEYCINKPILLTINVRNERKFRVELYKDGILIAQDYFNRTLNGQENIQDFRRLLGIIFERGKNYVLKIIGCNNNGCTKTWSLPFRIKRDLCIDLKDKEENLKWILIQR
ncbi:MAG: hypothetical protein R2766_01295 [Saprospiraceae bacterium]